MYKHLVRLKASLIIVVHAGRIMLFRGWVRNISVKRAMIPVAAVQPKMPLAIQLFTSTGVAKNIQVVCRARIFVSARKMLKQNIIAHANVRPMSIRTLVQAPG